MKEIPEVPFETLVEMVEQLPVEQQRMLLHRMQRRSHPNGRSVDEKMRILRSVQVDVAIKQQPSARREDWYNDDGR
jgi:hypothetical protein